MADVNLHSRSDRERNHFKQCIQNTTGEIIDLPRPSRPSSNTTSDVAFMSSILIPYSQLTMLDSIGSDHDPIMTTLDFPTR